MEDEHDRHTFEAQQNLLSPVRGVVFTSTKWSNLNILKYREGLQLTAPLRILGNEFRLPHHRLGVRRLFS